VAVSFGGRIGDAPPNKPDPLAMNFYRKSQGITFDDPNIQKKWRWKTVFSLPRMVIGF
jgi:hypothetical protein